MKKKILVGLIIFLGIQIFCQQVSYPPYTKTRLKQDVETSTFSIINSYQINATTITIKAILLNGTTITSLVGDNLGNHVATTTLNMSGYDIINVSTINVVRTLNVNGDISAIQTKSYIIYTDLIKQKNYNYIEISTGIKVRGYIESDSWVKASSMSVNNIDISTITTNSLNTRQLVVLGSATIQGDIGCSGYLYAGDLVSGYSLRANKITPTSGDTINFGLNNFDGVGYINSNNWIKASSMSLTGDISVSTIVASGNITTNGNINTSGNITTNGDILCNNIDATIFRGKYPGSFLKINYIYGLTEPYVRNINVSTITFSDGTILTSTKTLGGGGGGGEGDNLGNHTATQNLNMNSYSIVNVSTIATIGNIMILPNNTNLSNVTNSGNIILGFGDLSNNYNNSIGIGYNASNNYNIGLGIGYSASNNNDYGIGIGFYTSYNYNNGIGIGQNANNNYNNGIGIGYTANNNNNSGLGIGVSVNNNNNYGVGIGVSAFGNYSYGLGIGYNANSNRDYGIGIGYNARNNSTYALGIGYYSENNRPYSTSVGGYTFSASSSVSLGWKTRSEQVDSVALGAGAKTTAIKSTAIGSYVINNDTGTIKLGVGTNIPRDYIEMGKSNTSQATYIMLKSPNGTTYYFWINDVGIMQITTSKP